MFPLYRNQSDDYAMGTLVVKGLRKIRTLRVNNWRILTIKNATFLEY